MIRRKENRSRTNRRLSHQLLDQRQLLAGDVQLANDDVSLQQNAAQVSLGVLENDSFSEDYDGARQITSVSTGSEGGQIRIANDGGSLLYTPPADFSGQESFNYYVDGDQSATVNVSIKSPLRDFSTVILRLEDEYEFNLLQGAQFGPNYQGEQRITLRGNSSIGAELELLDDGKSVAYRPPVGIVGTDSFTYIVDNRFFATARIEIENVLDTDKFELLQHSATTNLDLLANDFSDHGSEVAALAKDAKISHVLPHADGIDVQISDDGRSVNFTPIDDYYGTASFRYVVNSRFEQSVRVYVQRPVRDDYELADQDGGQHRFNVLENDYYRSFRRSNSKIDVVDLVTSVEQGDSGGTVTISSDGQSLLYTPADGFVGTEIFQYTADQTYEAKVRVTVGEPVRDDFQHVFIDTETAIDVLANDFYGDLGAGASITSIGESQIGATIRLGNDGLLYYTPPQEIEDRYAGDDFQYTVNDTYTANVRVWFRSLTNPDSVNFDRPVTHVVDVLANDSFHNNYQGDRRITSVTAPSDGGTVKISDDGSVLEYTPGSTGETFQYTVDDRYTESVTNYPINRLRSDRKVVDQNSGTSSIDVLANDFKSTWVVQHYGKYTGPGLLTGVTDSQAGGAVGIVNGQVSYTPPEDFVGADHFEYIVDDFLTSTVVINVIRRADDDFVRVDPDSQGNQLNVLVNDHLGADYEGPGIITAVDGSAGSLSIAADGRSISYAPVPGFVGEDQFQYTVDGQSKATVTVLVRDQLDDALPQFDTIEQLRDHLLELSLDRWYGDRQYYPVEERDLHAVADSATVLGFSTTNVQVAGVDEDDLVETDGDFIYSLRGNELAIVSSLADGEMELKSQSAIEGHAIGMYLNGDRLMVVSKRFEHGYRYYDDTRLLPTDDVVDFSIIPGRSVGATTIVTLFDIRDRSEPTVVQTTTMDGDFVSSRRIDDQVFLVLNSGNLIFRPISITNDDGDQARESKEQFIARIQSDYAELLEEILPSYVASDSDSNLVRSGRLVVPEDIFVTGEDAESMTVVVSLNMAGSEAGIASTSGVLASNGGTIYANASSLYVFKPDHDPQDRQPSTQILKFDWDGQTGSIDFAATGTVAGRVLNQFSADQQDDILRITTSISNRYTGTFSGVNETAIFTLQDDRGVLEFVGSLQNVAPGENVKSVRYFGDRAFVTTFRTIDPLFAINLSDPADPWVMGHASIPGFSDYVQAISADRLLTVGRDRGTAFVSLFDISDFENPKLVDLYQLPRSTTSAANFDHHAFGWFAPHEILALPTGQAFSERWDSDGDGYPEATRRVVRDALTMLHVGVDDVSGHEGITLRGRIQHQNKVIRSVYIGQHIYSVGIDAIRAVVVGDENLVVGEVVYPDDPIVIDPMPVRHSLADARKAVRQMHAESNGVEGGRVMIVTQESGNGMIDTVLRVGQQHYRYSSEGETDASLVDDAFAFVAGWHNEQNQWDVNDDGEVTALDALLAINALARLNGSDLPADRVMRQVDAASKFVDTNGDGRLTALDALRVINRLSADDLESEHLSESSIAHYSAPKYSSESDDEDDRDLVATISLHSPVKI